MEIHSVKRDDGVIFTVGDKVIYAGTIREPILRFEMCEGVIKAVGEHYHLTLDNLSHNQKAK